MNGKDSRLLELWNDRLAEASTVCKQIPSVDAWKSLTLTCAAYFSSPEFAATEAHWFCGNEDTKYYAVTSLLVLSFEETAESKAFLDEYRAKLSQMLASCARCAIEYQISTPLLIEALMDKLKVPGEFLEKFYKSMEQSDKARISRNLDADPNSFASLTEALWSSACLSSKKFINSHFAERGPLTSADAVDEAAKFDANPGFMLFKYVMTPNLRRATLSAVVSGPEEAQRYIKAWRKSPKLFQNALLKGIRRNAQAKDLADSAWYTTACILKSLSGDSQIARTIADLSVKEMIGANGTPKFGAHFFLYVLLKYKDPSYEIKGLEPLIDYVTENRDLEYKFPLPKQLSAEMVSTVYRELDGRVVLEWLTRYVALKPDPQKIERRLSFLLDLRESAYKLADNYNKATLYALKVICANLPSLFSMFASERFAKSYDVLPSELIYLLWNYQQNHLDKELPIWNDVLHDSSFGNRTLFAPNEPKLGFITGMLEGSRKIGLIWQVPLKQSAIKSIESGKQQASMPERVITLLLESLSDVGDPQVLAPLIQNPRVLRSVLMLAVSGNRSLSLSAEEFLNQVTGEESLDDSVVALVNSEPAKLLNVISLILKESSEASATWLAVLPGITKLLLIFLDQIYDVNEGIDTTSDAEFTRGLLVFWNKSWNMVTNVIKQIKQWGSMYSSAYLKPILINILDLSKGLLSKFRLIEADLTQTSSEEKNWGATLAEPAMASVNNMSALLQLAIPDLLAMAFNVIIEILGLMRSFKVSAPKSLLELLQGLATRQIRSKLSKEELKSLLAAVGICESDIDLVVDHQTTGIVVKSDGPLSQKGLNVQHAQQQHLVNQHRQRLSTSPPSSSSQGQQRSLDDFFHRADGKRPELAPRKIVNNQVLPNAAPQSTALSQVKMLLSEGGAASSKWRYNKFGPIHPERPPGFNPHKPAASQNGDDDDDDDDDVGALASLGISKKREEALERLRQAHEASKTGKPLLPSLPTIGPVSVPSRQLQEDQKRLEERAKKARLGAQPVELHRNLLSWDYFADLPPVKSNGSIPDKFTSVQQYQEVMAPLLYLEAWEGIQRTKEEAIKDPPKLLQLVFGKRVKVDGFTDVYVSTSRAAFASSNISDAAVLLLGFDRGTGDEVMNPCADKFHFLARVKEGTIKVPRDPKKQHVDFQVRLNTDVTVLQRLNVGSTVNGVSIGVFTTVEREFTALMALPHYNLLSSILKASPTVATVPDAEVTRMQQVLKLNKSQATAVVKSTRNSGFSLIQGPPGTGKTKTILGIVGALLAKSQMGALATAQQMNADAKILICAPSNAAVDEIVLRLKAGVIDSNGKQQKLNILRLGRRDVVSEQNWDVTLEEMISQNLTDTADIADSSLRRDHTSLTIQRNELRDKLRSEGDKMSSEEIKELSDKVKLLSSQLRDKAIALAAQRERLDKARKQRDANYLNQQNEIITNAQVICSTLSGSAHPMLMSLGVTFENVIVDEAAQCIELSSLIPLKYGTSKVILVGDPNQLPPTVLSKEAGLLKYEQSLFVRMYDQFKNVPGAVCMLDTQFRMHPAISRFPSLEFYSGKLLDGQGLAEKNVRPWHREFDALGPYVFFDVRGTQQRYRGHSLRNQAEASAALALVKHILQKYPDTEKSIGVISPYKEQVRLMRNIFSQSLGSEISSTVDFNSIDGFQGQEKDIIIMSCVRASDSKTNRIGFLSDVRRMNVGLTRAKTSLWILGHAESLRVNSVWSRLLDDASERGCLVETQYTNDVMKAVNKFQSNSRKRLHDEPSPEPSKRRDTGISN